MTQISNEERRTLILTGASRGIGHATVKRFSSAGWRVITCSRQGFPENCPWEAGEEDHIQVDLADPDNTLRAIAVMKERLKTQGGRLNALVNNAAISPKGEGGSRLGSIDTDHRDWVKVFQVNFFAPIMLARGLVDQHNGQVPRTLDELVHLPGVGRKTANVVLGTAFGIPSGVVVDTHVERISKLLGLTTGKNAVKIEQDLMQVLPKKEWINFSHRLINHGRRICIARRPKCPECPLLKVCPRVGLPPLV